jgi:hypothetical protein
MSRRLKDFREQAGVAAQVPLPPPYPMSPTCM